MIELVHIPSRDLNEGAVVTPLCFVKDSPLSSFSWDTPKERCLFIEEGFATFECVDSFDESGVDIRLISQISWMDHYAWAIFGGWNINIGKGEVQRRSSPGGHAYVSQHFRLELQDGADLGYVQLVCLPSETAHGGEIYHQYDIITLHAYKNRKVRERGFYPGVLLLRPDMPQTYMPMVPGQHLQLIVYEDAQIDAEGVQMVEGMNKNFVMGGRQRMKSLTYACTDARRIDPIFISRARATNSVLVCGIQHKEQGSFVTVLKPIIDTLVYTEGLDGIEIVMTEDTESWVWDDTTMDVEKKGDMMTVLFKKPIPEVLMQMDSGHWWLSENVKVTVGKL